MCSFLSLTDHGGAKDADIVDGTVVVVADVTLDAVGDVHTFGDLAKDGVGAVEMGRAALAGDDVELAGAGEVAGVHVVALTGSSHRAVAMAQGGHDLGLELVGQIALAEQRSRLSMAAVRVARLDHEAGYDAVEQQGVVEVALDELQEVVAVARRLVVEGDADVAFGGLEEHFCTCRLGCVLGRQSVVLRLQRQKGRQAEEDGRQVSHSFFYTLSAKVGIICEIAKYCW